VTALSIDAWSLDLQAVVDRLQLDKFALFGQAFTGPAAIAYAARNADRVSRLILWCTGIRGADILGSPRDRILGAMMEVDWELYTETMAHMTYGWSAGDPARQFAARVRETLTPEKMKAAFRAIARMDAGEFIPQVQSPTLVLHRRQIPFMGADAPRGLAAGIKNARLTLLEGDSISPYTGDMEPVLRAVDEFLGEREKAPVPAPSEAGAFRTILFTDVEDSTPLTQRLGDADAREVLRVHERITREALREHGGSEVKTMGDGFMASFSSVTKALQCATAMQRAFAQQNASVAEPVLVRVGLNAGEPIEEEEDLFGTSVIMAARIAAKAQGGEILTSNVVRELVAGKGFLFSDRGDVVLRGFEDPVRLYEVRWREAG
jgi:class 3 adenylate cyclase